MLHSSLLHETVQLAIDDHVLILNSAADPFILEITQHLSTGELILAEDNLNSLEQFNKLVGTNVTPLSSTIDIVGADLSRPAPIYRPLSRSKTQLQIRHTPFHEYTLHETPATIDVAILNLLFQPSNAWMIFGLQLAAYALKSGGRLYVVGAKDRGILTIAKRMQALFGNLETLVISKGHRVICSHKEADSLYVHSENVGVPLAGTLPNTRDTSLTTPIPDLLLTSFAEGKLDEGTRLLIESLEVHATDVALDIGCGAGYIGRHVAQVASKGHVTMVDASLVAVGAACNMVEQSGLTNVQVLASNGTQAVFEQRFDLIVTNPPLHIGGIQTTEIGERFIRQAAHALRPRGRFYLVANRFLKYESTLQACFHTVEEVGGNTRYKVLLATNPILNKK
ncbi:MAG TPA: class I SAM-dependent methyltransferase [Ktedonobacteraceae bacterium]|nr:class I SAM-dependent methyltransferase [Ktedonobacteraceae bacterium]